MNKILIAFLLSFFIIPSAHALRFTNQFIEFELPAKWNCALEGAEWICQNTNEQKKRDAIIVLAAKLKGDQDTLDQYQEYLNKPRNFAGPNGKQLTSKPKYAKVIQINTHPWVDSIHMESELPNFYTRYLATIKQDIGVLVTYSIYQTKYQEYLNEFENMVKSMKVFRKPGAGVNTNLAQSIFNNAPLPNSFTQQGVFPEQTQTAEAPKPKPKGDDDLLLYLIIGAVALGGFIIYKKRRGGGLGS